MAKGYSFDLRERVIAVLQRGGITDEQAAKLFQIGEATVAPFGSALPVRRDADQEDGL